MTHAHRLAALAATVVLAGCSAQEQAQAPEPSASPSDQIRVGLTEWTIHTATAVAEPGELELVVTNAGGTEHDLVVTGEFGTWRTPLIEPGDRTTLEVAADAEETLHLDCSVPGHHESGMHTTLDVAAGH